MIWRTSCGFITRCLLSNIDISFIGAICRVHNRLSSNRSEVGSPQTERSTTTTKTRGKRIFSASFKFDCALSIECDPHTHSSSLVVLGT